MIGTTTTPQTEPLAALVQDHSAGIFRYLRSVVGDDEIARDLLQETFLSLAPRAHNAGRGLIYTVARSRALDYLRRQQTRLAHESPANADFIPEHPAKEKDRPDKSLATKTLRQDLLTALARLPESQRTVFHLSEVEELSYAEIAEVLNISAGTIASRKHHAVRKLRETLRRRGHGA